MVSGGDYEAADLLDSAWTLQEADVSGVEPASSSTTQTDNATSFFRIEVKP